MQNALNPALKMKKGIMLPFLLTVVVALMLFIPAILFASELFRTSEQAEESFNDLVKDLEDLADNNEDAIKTRLLIIDPKTFIATFKQDGERALVYVVDESIYTTPYRERVIDFYFEYPADYCQGGACVCLCQEMELLGGIEAVEPPASRQGNSIYESRFSCSNLYCKNLEKVKLSNNFGVTRPNYDELRASDLITNDDEPRRVQLKLEKVGEEISIIRE